MNNEEYQKYLDDQKNNLNDKQKNKLLKEYNKLPKSLNYWLKRSKNIIGYYDEEYLLKQYCEKRISYIIQRIEILEYFLDLK